MPEHAPRRPPPGLSKSQEVISYNQEEQMPLPFKDRLTPPRPIALDSSGRNSPSFPSFDYKTRYDVVDEGVNLPLLPLHAPQTVRLPLTRSVSSEGIVRIDVPHSSGSERGKDDNRLSDYRWTPSTDDINTEYHPPRRRIYSSSAEAQCAIEMPSPSPNYSRYFDTTPPSTSTLGRFPKPPAQHPFAKNFEVPQWRKLAIHTGLCALSYPFLLIFVIMGRGRTLFLSRLFVGAGCGILGVMLGLSLVHLARGVLEAATWATLIHQSRVPDTHGAGVRLKDLAAHSDDPTSSWTALRLLWDRHSYPGADREYRKFYDSRKWSIWIFFFLLNVILSGTMSFLLARAVDIDFQVVHQQRKYQEVVVSGDLSEDDLKRADAIQSAFENYALTWTLAPFSSHGELPAVLSLNWKNESVFFSEVVLSQLIPGGSGFGTFDLTETAPSLDIDSHDLMATAPQVGVETGSVLRFPRWGIRIKCTKIPDIPLNLVPLSENNFTYLFTPRGTIRPLFDDFDLPFPQPFEQPLNFSEVVHADDTLPSGLDTTGISMGAKFWNNGVAHSMKSNPLSTGQDGKGFITMENILVRLNTSFAPNGTFGIKGDYTMPDKDGFATFIGYDAAVCLELYEPWVLEVYNSSVGFPSSMRIVDKAAEIKDMNTEQMNEKRSGKPVSDPLVKRALNSTNMRAAYIAGHQNSVNQIVKDNGRDANYVPSPTLISFTGGDGPFGYTELSEVYYAKARALADANNVLPYFAGSGLVVARRYHDRVVTSAAINNVLMCITVVGAFIMGLISALFVPRLPLDVPRRGFDLYSWLSAFYAHELVAERPTGISKDMELRDIMDHTSELKFRYVG